MKHHIKFIEQLQQTECGICCAAMILRYYGVRIDMSELRRENDIGRDGSSLLDIKRLLEKYNMRCKVYKANIEGLKGIKLPTIIYWKESHFVILKSLKHNRVSVVDPEFGSVTYSKEEFSENYSEYVLCCEGNEIKTEAKFARTGWTFGREMIELVSKNRLLYLFIFLCSALSYGCALGFPVIIQKLIDSEVNAKIGPKILLVMSIAILYVFIEWLNSYLLVGLNANIDENINNKLYRKLLRVPYKFFEMREKAEILVSLDSGMVLRDVLVKHLIKGIIECGSIVVIFVYLFKTNVVLALISGVIFIVQIVFMIAMQFIIKERSVALLISTRNLLGIQTETIYSALNVKMLSLGKMYESVWAKSFQKYKQNYKKRDNLGNSLNIVTFTITNVVPLIMLVLGLRFMWSNKMTLGQVMAFYSLSGTFFSTAGSICAMIISWLNSTVYFDRIKDILDQENEANSDVKNKVDISGNITLKQVSFRYSKNTEYRLKGVNLEIGKGEKVAIVGKSGSGKSTLLKLISGLYPVCDGEIRFDDSRISDIDKDYLFSQIGVVPQDIMLLNKTILENIIVNRENITRDEVEQACKLTGIYDDIMSMPMQFNTIISDMGLNLSGGQRQRIALARAICSKPRILLLDEATSSLDSIYEKKITNGLKEMKMTRVIVAHRLSTILDSDKIVVMDEGEVIDEGRHEELMSRCELYNDLYKSLDVKE